MAPLLLVTKSSPPLGGGSEKKAPKRGSWYPTDHEMINWLGRKPSSLLAFLGYCLQGIPNMRLIGALNDE